MKVCESRKTAASSISVIPPGSRRKVQWRTPFPLSEMTCGFPIKICLPPVTSQLRHPLVAFPPKRNPGSDPASYYPRLKFIKAGVNMKAVFWLGITILTQISRSRFKQSRISMFISHIYVLGRFVNFLVIFRYIWR